jgi:predicted PurR-regulated permease PerM
MHRCWVSFSGQFLLMLLAACYLAGEIILPIVLAFVLSLVLQPLMRLLEKLHLPRSLAALAIIMVLGGSIIGLGAALSGPAVSWAQKLPEGLPRLQERLSFLNKPIHTLQKFLHQAEGLTQEAGPAVSTVIVQGSGWSDKLLSGTRTIASGLFTTVLVLFSFHRRRHLPAAACRDPAAVQRQASGGRYFAADRRTPAYLTTITVMNLGVGIGIVTAAWGGDPVLWGTVTFLLNYVPILGPMIGDNLVFAGLLSVETLWLAFVPAGVYVLIHVVEGETITPMLLKRFTINPVLVILALVFWYWM